MYVVFCEQPGANSTYCDKKKKIRQERSAKSIRRLMVVIMFHYNMLTLFFAFKIFDYFTYYNIDYSFFFKYVTR